MIPAGYTNNIYIEDCPRFDNCTKDKYKVSSVIDYTALPYTTHKLGAKLGRAQRVQVAKQPKGVMISNDNKRSPIQ